ncbi:MAG: hypothetical protein H7X80_10950, partial [bacterium]|nr:hypothetical protein [Candidatus Kapabacteria bacterium]
MLTPMSNDEMKLLRDRIESFELDDPGVSFSFTARLARDNDWSREYAQRVVTEYRRFVYLAMAAGHPITPSIDVDEAWHLHMTYTRSYWERMCAEVLGKPLHHDPTSGGAKEGSKFNDWYERTLESYQRLFDEEPPPDIWPPSNVRFDRASLPKRVTGRTHFVVRRNRIRLLAQNAVLLFVGAAILVAIGCGSNADDTNVTVGVFLGAFIIAVTLLFIALRRRSPASSNQFGRRRKRYNSSDGSAAYVFGDSGSSHATGDSENGGPHGGSHGGSHEGSHGGWGGDSPSSHSDSTSADSSSGCGS